MYNRLANKPFSKEFYQGEQMAMFTIRPATPDDHNSIYTLKGEAVRPYVEKIWGWDEQFQRNDFDRDYSMIEHFHVIENKGKFLGFVQCFFESPYLDIAEIHLLPEYRGKGIGSDILRNLQNDCVIQNKKSELVALKKITALKISIKS